MTTTTPDPTTPAPELTARDAREMLRIILHATMRWVSNAEMDEIMDRLKAHGLMLAAAEPTTPAPELTAQKASQLRYNYGDKQECRSGVQPPSGVALRHRRSEMRAKSIPQLSPEQIERFWAKVEVHQPSGCWEWTACRHSTGYGLVGLHPHGTYRAHRVAYTLLIGPIPDGLVVDHLCRNASCVNPDHIQVVSQQENTIRAYGPSAKNHWKTHCNNGHEFTPENTDINKSGERRCRTCRREWDRRNTPRQIAERKKIRLELEASRG